MWTYLLIFICILTIFAVFFRRVVFVLRGKDAVSKDKIFDDSDGDVYVTDKKNRMSKIEKSEAESLCKRGQVLLNAGKDEEAIKCFVQALAIDPRHKESLGKLGVLYMHKQMFAAASALFKDLVLLEEDSVHYSHLGLAFFKLNELEKACEAYQKAIELDETRPQRFVSLCQVYRSLQKPEIALIALNKALALEPENPDYLFLLADLYFEIEKGEEAKKVLKLILEKDPENSDARKLLRKK